MGDSPHVPGDAANAPPTDKAGISDIYAALRGRRRQP